MLRTTLVLAFVAPAAMAQFVYDFNHLNGSDPHPFTPLHGQDSWSEQAYNSAQRCGVTATLSHDGTPALRFQEVGPGTGCDASRINDAGWLYAPFLGNERNAFFEADMRLGYWGGQFGLAYDANGNGQIRGSEAGEVGVRFVFGSQANVQLRVIAADGTAQSVSLASIGIGGGSWVRVRVVMDLTANGGAGSGAVFVRNITVGATDLVPVPGLQNVPLGLNPAATNAANPVLWNAMWLHFEGATYELDNIQVGRAGYALPFGSGCAGAFGPVALTAQSTWLPGAPLTLSSSNHAPNALGVAIFGFSNTMHGGLALPLLLDPMLGTSGCSLLCSIDGTATLFSGPSGPAAMAQTITLPLQFVGWRIHLQHACFEPVPGGTSWSNALTLQLP